MIKEDQIMFLPIIYLGGYRWRIRARLINRKRLWPNIAKDAFLEGLVYRIWIGPILITIMVDKCPY